MCALKMEITSSTGLIIEEAYVKVDEYSCSKNNIVNAKLRAYVSKELSEKGAAFIEGSEDIFTLDINYSDEADNAKKQIYEFVKNFDKYSGALDV